jgi:hypothetical protein
LMVDLDPILIDDVQTLQNWRANIGLKL